MFFFNNFLFIDSIEKGQYRWLRFRVKNNTLLNKPVKGSFGEKMALARIQVMGLTMDKISRVFVDDKEIPRDQFHYNKQPSVSKYFKNSIN